MASQNQVYMLKQRNSDWKNFFAVGSDKNTNSKTILSTVPNIYMTWNTFLELKR